MISINSKQSQRKQLTDFVLQWTWNLVNVKFHVNKYNWWIINNHETVYKHPYTTGDIVRQYLRKCLLTGPDTGVGVVQD